MASRLVCAQQSLDFAMDPEYLAVSLDRPLSVVEACQRRRAITPPTRAGAKSSPRRPLSRCCQMLAWC